MGLCQSTGGQGEREMANASLISELLHDPAWEHVKLLKKMGKKKKKSNALKERCVDGSWQVALCRLFILMQSNPNADRLPNGNSLALCTLL